MGFSLNAFAHAEVEIWSSPSKVLLFEATWLYSLAISKIIVSVTIFGFPYDLGFFYHCPFLFHICSTGNQIFFQQTLLVTSVQQHLFRYSTFLHSFVSSNSVVHFNTIIWFAPDWLLVKVSTQGQHFRAFKDISKELVIKH